MIKIFGQTDKIFSSNGDVVIQPLKAKVRKGVLSELLLDAEAP